MGRGDYFKIDNCFEGSSTKTLSTKIAPKSNPWQELERNLDVKNAKMPFLRLLSDDLSYPAESPHHPREVSCCLHVQTLKLCYSWGAERIKNQVIQAVTFLSPNVGGHLRIERVT